jgi:hypothetical protein
MVAREGTGQVLSPYGISDIYWSWGVWYNGNGKLRIGTHAKDIKTANAVITAGSWHHITYTYNNGSHKLYVGGNPVALVLFTEVREGDVIYKYEDGPYNGETSITVGNTPVSMQMYPSDKPITAGFMNFNNNLHGYYIGQLDEIMFFDRELTAAEAKGLAQ